MNATSSTAQTPSGRRRWLLLALLAVAVTLAGVSVRELMKARASAPPLASAARTRLETRDEKFYQRGASVPFTGWMTDHFTNGAVKLRSAVVDGLLHGESEGWHENGAPELLEHFQRGVPEGSRVTWHANGQKRSEGRLVAGQQQGLYRQWDEEGNLAAEAEFESGKPHGLSLAWYPSGCLKAEVMMKHGVVQARHVYPDGARREPALLAGNPIP